MIILISGKMGSGKTTVARDLQIEILKRGFVPRMLKFADPLYQFHDEIRSMLKSIDPKNTINYDYGKKDGNLLQLLGTEWGRTYIDENVWVKLLMSRVHQMPTNHIKIIDDCRFRNELLIPKTMAEKTGEKIVSIRLECDVEIRRKRCTMWRDKDNHPSETDLDDYARRPFFDYVFNTGLERGAEGTNPICQIVLDDILQNYELL